jgi:hypothetical protein
MVMGRPMAADGTIGVEWHGRGEGQTLKGKRGELKGKADFCNFWTLSVA